MIIDWGRSICGDLSSAERREWLCTNGIGGFASGTVWAFFLGPFALAHFKAYGDVEAARSVLSPLAHHLSDYGLGSIAEIFDGDSPFASRGCIAQAWSVADTLRVLAAACRGMSRRRRAKS